MNNEEDVKDYGELLDEVDAERNAEPKFEQSFDREKIDVGVGQLLPDGVREEVTRMADAMPVSPLAAFKDNTFTPEERKRRQSRILAAQDTLFSSDIERMTPEFAAGFYRAIHKALFDLEDPDGKVAFGSRASDDPKKNLDMLRRFCRGEHQLISSDEKRAWDAMPWEERFRYALEHETKGNALASHIEGERGVSFGEMVAAGVQSGAVAFSPTEGRPTEIQKDVSRRIDYESMTPDEKRKYEADVIGDYEERMLKDNRLAAYLELTAGLSDKAKWLVAKGVNDGECDMDALRQLRGAEPERALTAIKMARGNLTRGQILGIDTDFSTGTTGDRLQMGLYGFQQGVIGLFADTAKFAENVGAYGVAKALKDNKEFREFSDTMSFRAKMEQAFSQDLPESDSFMGEAYQGVMENLHWGLSWGLSAYGKGLMAGATGIARPTLGATLKALAAKPSAWKGVIAEYGKTFKLMPNAKLANMGKGLKAAEADFARKQMKSLGTMMAASAEGKETAQLVNPLVGEYLTRQAAAVDRLRKNYDAARRIAMRTDGLGAGLATTGSMASFATFAQEYMDNAVAAGVDWDDALVTAVGVGLINAKIENIWIPGVEGGLTRDEIGRLTWASFQQALANTVAKNGRAGLKEYFANWGKKYLASAGRAAFEEGIIEEPLQQIVIEHGIAFDKILKEYGYTGPTQVLKAFLPTADDWKTFVDTAIEMLPNDFGFALTSLPMAVGRQSRNQAVHNLWARKWHYWRDEQKRRRDWVADHGSLDGYKPTPMPKMYTATGELSPEMVKGDYSKVTDLDYGVVDMIQNEINLQQLVKDEWTGEEEGSETRDPKKERGTRLKVAERIQVARDAWKANDGTGDVVGTVADALGVGRRTAEVACSVFEAESGFADFNAKARKVLNANFVLASLTEADKKEINPYVVDGSFERDERTGSVKVDMLFNVGKDENGKDREPVRKTVVYRSGSSVLSDEDIPVAAARGSNFGKSWIETHKGEIVNGRRVETWDELSDDERQALVKRDLFIAKGSAGPGATVEFTDKDGNVKKIDADFLVSFATGRVGDIGYGTAAKRSTMFHENFHVLWDSIKEFIPEETRKDLARKLGINVADGRDWDGDLQEHMAAQIEAYSSGRVVPQFSQNAIEGMQRGIRGALGGLLDMMMPRTINPETGKEYELRNFYDAVLRGDIGNAAELLKAATGKIPEKDGGTKPSKGKLPGNVTAEELAAKDAETAKSKEGGEKSEEGEAEAFQPLNTSTSQPVVRRPSWDHGDRIDRKCPGKKWKLKCKLVLMSVHDLATQLFQSRDFTSKEYKDYVDNLALTWDVEEGTTIDNIVLRGVPTAFTKDAAPGAIDKAVFAGNTRTSAILKIYENGGDTADAFKESQEQLAEERGLERANGWENDPVVIALLEEVEVPAGEKMPTAQEIADASNENVSRAYRTDEKAQKDATKLLAQNLISLFKIDPKTGKIIDDDDAYKIGEKDPKTGKISFVNPVGKFYAESGGSDNLPDYYRPGTTILSDDGQRTLRNAILSALFGGRGGETVARLMSEADRLGMQNEMAALMQLAPELLSLANDREHAKYDLRGPLVEALGWVQRWLDADEAARKSAGKTHAEWKRRKDGKPVEPAALATTWENFREGDMTEKPSEEAVILGDLLAAAHQTLAWFQEGEGGEERPSEASKLTARRLITGYVRDYLENVGHATAPVEDGLFGGTEDAAAFAPPTTAEILRTQRGTRFSVGLEDKVRQHFPEGTRFSVGTIRPATAEEYADVIARFGETNDYGEAAWLFPDGRMPKPQMKRTRWGTMAKNRDAIFFLLKDRSHELGNMSCYIDTFAGGAMRLDLDNGGIEMTRKPSAVQMDAIYDICDAAYQKMEADDLDTFRVDISDDNGSTLFTLEYPRKTSARRIIDDIKNYYDSGWIPDNATGPEVERRGGTGAAMFSIGRLYTGSAADYEKPSLLKVGTGEGAQVYGWGLYASTERSVADYYAGGWDPDDPRSVGIADRVHFLRNGVEVDGRDSPAYNLVISRIRLGKEGAIEDLERLIQLYEKHGELDHVENARKAIEELKTNDWEMNYGQYVYEQTFFTNRAPGDESHLLKWYEPVSEEQAKWIVEQAKKEGVGYADGNSYVVGGMDLANYKGKNLKAETLYKEISRDLGSPQATSEFLARAGIDGVKYPVDSYGGKAVKDGDKTGWNYVSFRDDNIRVDHKWVDGQKRFSIAARLNEEREEIEAKGGQLLLAHHGTDSRGFTRFEKSDDIGYFFAKSRNSAASYIRKGRRGDEEKPGIPYYTDVLTYLNDEASGYTPEEVAAMSYEEKIQAYTEGTLENSGVYDVALKMEDPYVIDCHGANWNAIYEIPDGMDQRTYDRVILEFDPDVEKFKLTTREYSEDGDNELETVEFVDFESFKKHLAENMGDTFAMDELEDLEQKAKSGEYGMFEPIDGRQEKSEAGAMWTFDAVSGEGWGIYPRKTREIVEDAANMGCDGVIFHNVVDSGGGIKDADADDVYVVMKPEQVKSVDSMTYADDGSIIPAEARFDWSNKDIRWSIGGSLGSLRAGRTRDFDAALRMLDRNYNPLYVWKKTGYWKGKDGQLRFEIPDGKMKDADSILKVLKEHDNNAMLGEIMDAPELFKAYPDLEKLKVHFDPEPSDSRHGFYSPSNDSITVNRFGLYDYPDLWAKRLQHEQRKIDDPAYLDRFISNSKMLKVPVGTREEELAKAHEKIGKINKDIEDYQRSDATRVASDPSRDILIHEIQHAIQEREGFAKGMAGEVARKYAREILGSTNADDAWLTEARQNTEELIAAQAELKLRKYVRFGDVENAKPEEWSPEALKRLDRFTKDGSWQQYGDSWSTPRKSRSKKRQKLRHEQIIKAIKRMVDDEVMSKHPEYRDKTNAELEDVIRAANKWSRDHFERVQDAKDKRELASKLATMSDYEIYLAFAGEVEARQAVARAKMSDAEREETPPWESEDTPRGGQIVRYSIAGTSGAGRIGIGTPSLAEKMEKSGRNRFDIWRDTGWWRGHDGKWRVELPDYRAGQEIATYRGFEEKNEFTLGEILSDDVWRSQFRSLAKLTKAYPKLLKLNLRFKDNPPDGLDVKAAYMPGENAVEVYKKAYDDPHGGAGFSIVHELQHAIQWQEGFSYGDLSATTTGEKIGKAAKKKYFTNQGEVEAYLAQARSLMSDFDRAADPPYETEKRMLDAIGRQFGINIGPGDVRFSIGTVWRPDFPDATAQTTRAYINGHYAELFKRAKAGDIEAASDLVEKVCKVDKIRKLGKDYPNAKLVAPVVAFEKSGHNQIPRAFAEYVAEILGIDVANGIVQTVRAGHTGADASHRLFTNPEFDGEVEKGAEYIIVDDHITQGGTVNALRDHIERNGGKVVAVASLTLSQGSSKLSPRKDTLDELYAKWPDIDNLLRIGGIAESAGALTQSQAKYILKFSPDTFRNRAIAQGVSGGGRVLQEALGASASAEVSPSHHFSIGASPSEPLVRAMNRRTWRNPQTHGVDRDVRWSVGGTIDEAFPQLREMSDDELVIAAEAVRLALNTKGKGRFMNITRMQRDLRGLDPSQSHADLGVRAVGVTQAARNLAKKMRADLDRGVSESKILAHLPDTMKEVFGSEMTARLRTGAKAGVYAERARKEIERRQEKVITDAVAIQSGVETKIMENAYGLDFSRTLMNLAENPYIRTDENGNRLPPERGEGEEGSAPDEQSSGSAAKPVEAKVAEAVNEVARRAHELSEAEKSKKEELRRQAGRDAENQLAFNQEENAAAADAGEGGGAMFTGDEDLVDVATRKAGVNLADPRELALFVSELSRKYWNDTHGLGEKPDTWNDPVAMQFLRKTAANIYTKLVNDLVYSQARDTATRAINRFENVPTARGLVSEMTFVGQLIHAKRMADTQREMCNKLDAFLKEKFGAAGRFSPDKEELRRTVSAEMELRARYTRHVIWLTPDALNDEIEAMRKNLHGVEVEFDDAGRDVDQSKVMVETMRKLQILREFGGLVYKPLAQIQAAIEYWEDALRGDTDRIVRDNYERDLLTEKAAAKLAAAFDNPKLKTALEKNWKSLANDYIESHMGFFVLLRDLMRFAPDDVRRDAEPIIDYLELAVQKAGTRAMSGKRRHGDALAQAVQAIYRRDFQKVLAEFNQRDDRFLEFMGEVSPGKREIPTKGKAMQLFVSLLQVGHPVEVADKDGGSHVEWVGGYHDNIVKNHREGQAEKIRRLLSVEDLNLIAWLGKWYEANRENLSTVAEALFGIGVYAETANYMPVKMLLDPQGLEKGNAVGWTIFPRSLTPRIRNERDFDTSADILSMFMSRMEESEQWAAHAKLGLELRGIFGRSVLRKSLRANHGKSADQLVQGFITDILSGRGAGDLTTGKFSFYADRIRGMAALGALGGNLGVTLKQTTSIPAFGFELGLAKTAKYILSAWSQDGFAAMREIFDSAERKNRWDVGNSEAVKNALSMNASGTLMKMLKASMITNKVGDVVPALVVGQGIYRDALARGMSREDAMARTWMLIERTQQSSRLENQPEFVRRSRAARALFQFLTTQVQYLGYEAKAIREVMAKPGDVRRWGSLGSTLVLNHFLLSSLYYWMGQLWKRLLGQEPPPDDELADWMVTCILGPFGALYVAGFTATEALNVWVKDKKFGSQPTLPSLSWASNIIIHDPGSVLSAIFSHDKGTLDDVLSAAGKWLADFNATFRDLRKVYRYRIKKEPQRK